MTFGKQTSCVNLTDELHPFRPATNSALWKLLIKLFPETALISQEPLKPGQKAFFFHGALLMPWIWWNRSLCPAQDSNWVGMIVSISKLISLSQITCAKKRKTNKLMSRISACRLFCGLCKNTPGLIPILTV